MLSALTCQSTSVVILQVVLLPASLHLKPRSHEQISSRTHRYSSFRSWLHEHGLRHWACSDLLSWPSCWSKPRWPVHSTWRTSVGAWPAWTIWASWAARDLDSARLQPLRLLARPVVEDCKVWLGNTQEGQEFLNSCHLDQSFSRCNLQPEPCRIVFTLDWSITSTQHELGEEKHIAGAISSTSDLTHQTNT